MSQNKPLSPKHVTTFLLFFLTVTSTAQNNNNVNTSSSCPSSSCGNIETISFPFRLRGQPVSCGYNDPVFELECENNHTILTHESKRYNVQQIDYEGYSIRLADPSISRTNLSSCTVYDNSNVDWIPNIFDGYLEWNVPVVFVHCLVPVNSLNYVESAFCGDRSYIYSNTSQVYSYVIVGEIELSDLEETCMVDRVNRASTRRNVRDDLSLAGIYDGLAYGFEGSWYRILCGECESSNGFCRLEGNNIVCRHYCRDDFPLSELPFRCRFNHYGRIIGVYIAKIVAGVGALKFLCGFTFLIVLVVYKYRRSHLSMDETIEEFLQGQNNLTPIKYTYSEIKKMTNNFNQRLGEGGYGTVYKGQLRSGPYVAVKLMGKAIASDLEFISEVGTISHIHHVNVVQLIGFCVEGSKCALVYEFLPNGSLDKYIFIPHGFGGLALKYEKMFEIALGVARGIDYLHNGCDMQILHFDIKPHNILIDDNFNPKISDFGLAKLYPSDGSVVNLASARGTMGYMAPEMFYKKCGGVSYKADVYSFGMLLMEMVGRRKNMNPFAEDSQIYFPSWAYDKYSAGEEIEMNDTTDEERKMIKKIIIVALWCIQMKPTERPSMNKVVEMLEGDSELQMPPKPFVAPREIAEDHGMSKDPLV